MSAIGNAISPHPRMTLLDRFTLRDGTVLITGVQALVRLMLVQADRDRAAGLKTGGFVSGYRGSPLGTLDSAFNSVEALTAERGIVVRPAVNEELAATAIVGSQQIEQTPSAKVQGVFSLWYGKGPGLDRASDAIRHGVYQGTSPLGGVVAAIGDDHMAKSSSVVCNSNEVAAGLLLPIFYPADATEIVAFGLHGFALSRHTGSWVGLKIVPEVADSTHTARADEAALAPILPPLAMSPTGYHNHWPDVPLEQEARHVLYRLPAVKAYVRANGLDRTFLRRSNTRIGVVAAGKSWMDLQEALRILGLDEPGLLELGIALYKPAMIWPLEPTGLSEFAQGLEALVIVEEKGPFLEDQIKSILYGQSGAPAVLGKSTADGAILFPAAGDLTPEFIAVALGGVLSTRGHDTALRASLAAAIEGLSDLANNAVAPVVRKPFFCSGCPHNRSTVVPEGSRAMAGIGCHGLAAFNRPATGTYAQMGGEGVHWVGLAPFTDEPHMFANMGDGTYFHSGVLAIRQAVAADLNITFKLLYNNAVAMTGGQPVDGDLSVDILAHQLKAEGVANIVVCTDDIAKYAGEKFVRELSLRIEPREHLEQVQLELREVRGVSVLIYDQMCATEKRRLRKRGKIADIPTRTFINELVCEGCSDCSTKSNCLSVEPVDTPFGDKRRINQSSCNKDFSCVEGFCPSFVTVENAKLKKGARARTVQSQDALPQPDRRPTEHQKIMLAGVGGTGIVTVGALLSTAAHIGGRKSGVLDQVGMAQKGGAVVSHVHIANEPVTALRIPARQADLLIVCDQIVANSRDVTSAARFGTTKAVVNEEVAITGDFVQDRHAIPDRKILERRLSLRIAPEDWEAHPFTALAEGLFGDAIASNLMMVGLAWQKGWLDLDSAGIEEAITLNGAGADLNRQAFEWGRRLALTPAAVYAAAGVTEKAPEGVEEIIEAGRAFLADYQDKSYAERYLRPIRALQNAELALGDDHIVTMAAARSLLKLMAYKDEYEVARLYTDGAFRRRLAEQFEGRPKISYHMAPPLISALRGGAPAKIRISGWWFTPVLRLLAQGRRLRGTALDPFGRTEERRLERRLAAEFEEVLDELGSGLSRGNLALAAEIAALPLDVRGYGHVKFKAATAYEGLLSAKLAQFRAGGSRSESSPARSLSLEQA